MRPGKPFSAKIESLGSFLTKCANGSNVSPHKGYTEFKEIYNRERYFLVTSKPNVWLF